MEKEHDREIYRKLKKLYEEMGWFQPFPTFEELLEEEESKPETLRIRISLPDSSFQDCERKKDQKKKTKKVKKRNKKKKRK